MNRYSTSAKGFGEPMEGIWDGFQRINTDSKSGGIIGIFRNGAVETKRMVVVNYLDPGKTYSVKTIDGKKIALSTGDELKTMGIEVNITERYGGELFEISLSN